MQRAVEARKVGVLSGMKFSSLVKRISGEGSDAWVTHYAARVAEDRGEDVVVLSVGDPDLDTAPEIVDRAVDRLRAGDTHYTPAGGRESLRAAIAALHRRRTGQVVGADQVAVLAGGQNGLFATMMCLAGPGDEVIALDPMYTTYPATIEAGGARLVRVVLSGDREFRFDAEAFRAALTERTRIVVLTTPNNPTGVILSEADLAVVAEEATRRDLVIVSDEVYSGIAPGGRVPGLAAALPERVVSIGSLSKTHAMTGWRVGWLVGPRECVTAVEALTMCMLFGLPGFLQEAAVTAIGMSERCEATVRDYLAEREKLMLAGLAGAPGTSVRRPDAGMFVLLDVRGTGLGSGEFMNRLYATERVSVVDGAAFGRATDGFVRLSFATRPDLITEGCRRIRRFCAALAS
jgi:octopine/nopaline transport system ATP-binding protein